MPLAERYDSFLFDLDGVLYRGDEAMPHAPGAMARLRKAGARLVFMTNNSSRTPEQVASKLGAVGIAAKPKEVVTSALATAELLAARGGGSAFVVGQDGLRSALQGAGLEIVDGAPRVVDYVVVGFDGSADYEKLKVASLLVERGAKLVATNPDASFPAADGLWPGAGALLAVITTTTLATPEIVGKPFAPLFEASLRRAGGARPLVVGDRLDTDIAGAASLGWDSLLVLTGVSSAEDARTADPAPTYVGEDLRALFDDSPRRDQPGNGYTSRRERRFR